MSKQDNVTDNVTDTTDTIEKVEFNTDEFFEVPGAENVTLAEEKKPNIMDPINPEVDMTFTEPIEKEEFMEDDDLVVPETVTKKTDAGIKAEGSEIIDDLDSEDDGAIEKEETRGRKPIEGINDVIGSLVNKVKLFAFEGEKSVDEYNAKDIEELIEANIEEARNEVRRETPKQFFEALPNELKVAARYVADGGTDLKGLFRTLAQAEETFELDASSERGQEKIIMEYLTSTGYGTPEEINEEIEIWKDLGKLEHCLLYTSPSPRD